MAAEVSVILPVYDGEPFLRKAIESVLSQTESNLELIAINDGSTDSSLSIIEQYAKKDNRIVIVNLDKNQGLANARNIGLQRAIGNWIAFLDADDWFSPDRLEILIAAGTKQKADMVADSIVVWQPTSEAESDLNTFIYPEEPKHPFWVSPERYLIENMPQYTSLTYGYLKPIIARNFLQTNNLMFDPELRQHEDFQFFFNCLMKGARFLKIPTAHYYYWTHRRTSISNLATPYASLHRHELFLKVNTEFLYEARERNLDDIERLLLLREKKLKEFIAYDSFTGYLKEKKWHEAFNCLRSNLSALPAVIILFCKALAHRLRLRFAA